MSFNTRTAKRTIQIQRSETIYYPLNINFIYILIQGVHFTLARWPMVSQNSPPDDRKVLHIVLCIKTQMTNVGRDQKVIF